MVQGLDLLFGTFELWYRQWGAMVGFGAEEFHDEFLNNVEDVTIY